MLNISGLSTASRAAAGGGSTEKHTLSHSTASLQPGVSPVTGISPVQRLFCPASLLSPISSAWGVWFSRDVWLRAGASLQHTVTASLQPVVSSQPGVSSARRLLSPVISPARSSPRSSSSPQPTISSARRLLSPVYLQPSSPQPGVSSARRLSSLASLQPGIFSARRLFSSASLLTSALAAPVRLSPALACPAHLSCSLVLLACPARQGLSSAVVSHRSRAASHRTACGNCAAGSASRGPCQDGVKRGRYLLPERKALYRCMAMYTPRLPTRIRLRWSAGALSSIASFKILKIH